MMFPFEGCCGLKLSRGESAPRMRLPFKRTEFCFRAHTKARWQFLYDLRSPGVFGPWNALVPQHGDLIAGRRHHRPPKRTRRVLRRRHSLITLSRTNSLWLTVERELCGRR